MTLPASEASDDVAAVEASVRALNREHFLAAVTGSPAGAVALAEEMDRRLSEHEED